MKKLATLLGVIALAALTWAQGATGISGTITNVATGKPLAGAFVFTWHGFGRPDSGHVMPPGHRGGGHRFGSGKGSPGMANHNGPSGGRSDSIGFYEITGLHPGKYIVRARALGFELATYPDTVVVDSGGIVTGINLALAPDTTLGAISGHVTDAVTHQPLADAFVCAWHSMLPDSLHRRPRPDSGFYPPRPHGDSGFFPPHPHWDSAHFPPGDSGHRHGMPRGHWPFGDSADISGYHKLSYLRPGRYIVSARCTGYEPAIDTGVVVVLGDTTFNINFALKPTTKTAGGSPVSTAGFSTSGNNSAPTLAIAPNPFHGNTSVLLSLPDAANISLRVYDASGKLVNEVAQGYFEAGAYAVGIDATKLAHGVYLVKLGAGSTELAQKLIVQ